MAILKMISVFHPSSEGKYTSMKRGINYISNKRKTNGGLLIGANNCMAKTAFEDMLATRQYWGKDSDWEKDRQGYHWTISWKPEEHVDYELALEIGKEFCQKVLGEYEAIYTVHTDKPHTHIHIIFNSVNFTNGHKFRYDDGDWAKIYQSELDRICKAHKLQTLYETTGLTNEEYYRKHISKKNKIKKKMRNMQKDKNMNGKARSGNNKYYNEKKEYYTKSDYIRKDIDDAILASSSIDEFYKNIKDKGYTIRHGVSEEYGNYFTLSAPGIKGRRNYKLGEDYYIDSIIKRIDERNSLPDEQLNQKQEMNALYIVSYKYWRRTAQTDIRYNDIQKKYAVDIYGRGIRDVKKSNYYDVKNALREIKKIEYRIDLIDEYAITSSEAADIIGKELENELKELQKEKRRIYRDKIRYAALIHAYETMQDNEMAYYAYINGASESKEGYDMWISNRDFIAAYGFDSDDIINIINSFKIKLKINAKDIRNLKKKIKAITAIKSDYMELNSQIVSNYEKLPYSDEIGAGYSKLKEQAKNRKI